MTLSATTPDVAATIVPQSEGGMVEVTAVYRAWDGAYGVLTHPPGMIWLSYTDGVAFNTASVDQGTWLTGFQGHLAFDGPVTNGVDVINFGESDRDFDSFVGPMLLDAESRRQDYVGGPTWSRIPLPSPSPTLPAPKAPIHDPQETPRETVLEDPPETSENETSLGEEPDDISKIYASDPGVATVGFEESGSIDVAQLLHMGPLTTLAVGPGRSTSNVASVDGDDGRDSAMPTFSAREFAAEHGRDMALEVAASDVRGAPPRALGAYSGGARRQASKTHPTGAHAEAFTSDAAHPASNFLITSHQTAAARGPFAQDLNAPYQDPRTAQLDRADGVGASPEPLKATARLADSALAQGAPSDDLAVAASPSSPHEGLEKDEVRPIYWRLWASLFAGPLLALVLVRKSPWCYRLWPPSTAPLRKPGPVPAFDHPT